MAQKVNTSNIPQTTSLDSEQTRPMAAVPGNPSGITGATGITGSITRVISKRRSNRRQWRILECIVMIILDAWLISLSFWLAFQLRVILQQDHSFLSTFLSSIRDYLLTTDPVNKVKILEYNQQMRQLHLGVVIGLMIIFGWRGLYSLRLTGSWFRQAWNIISSCTIGAAFFITYFFIYQPEASSRLLVPMFWATSIVILCGCRLVVSGIVGMLYRLGIGETRLLVVGSGRLGKMVMQHVAATPNLGYTIVGFLSDLNEPPSDFGRFKMLGTLDDIAMVIRSMHIDEVIIALPAHMHHHAIRSVKMCERLGASFKLIPDLYEMNLSRIDMGAMEGIPLINIKPVSLNTLQRLITRVVDITVSLLVLVLGSPLWLFIILAIKLNSPGPAIYKQNRVGLDGCTFKMYKFRSMYQDAEQRLAQLLARNEAQGPLFKMKDDPRRTPIGRFLRSTSLDEIPQFYNVFKGDMSLVGPRPPLPSEVAQYEEWQKGRFAIKPGISGLWQVRGRSNISFDEGILMDLYYIENWSLRLYFQILLRTVPAVLLRRGAY